MATPVTLASILKIIQKDQADPLALVRKSALGKSIKHEQDFQGKEITWSVPYAGLGGGSHDPTEAEANDQNGRYGLYTTGKAKSYFDQRTLDGQLTRQALKGDISSAYVEYVAAEQKLATNAVTTRVWNNAYRTITGRRAVIASISTNTLTLTNQSDVYGLNIGDKLVAAVTDGGALRTGSPGYATIVSRNPSAKTVTVDAASQITSLTAGDSLYVKGDPNKAFHGLGDYNPKVAPTSGDSVFGSFVDRSLDPDMLAGIRFDTTGMNKDTCLIRLMAVMENSPGWDAPGAKIFANPLDIADIAIAKEGARFIDSANQYDIGIEGFRVTSSTPTMLVGDAFCPEGEFRLVGEAGFELHTNDGVVIDEADGNSVRKKSGDTYALMALVDGDFISKKPYLLAVGTWPAN